MTQVKGSFRKSDYFLLYGPVVLSRLIVVDTPDQRTKNPYNYGCLMFANKVVS